MQLFTPTFTFQFQCIADKCEYSCCKNWSIIFDENDRNKFLKYGIEDINTLSSPIGSDKYKMKQNINGSCPYLEESGLCRMINMCGHDNVLCNTCQSFPRIINPKNDYIEYTLSNACPAVIDILNNTPCPITFEVVDTEDPIEADGRLPQELIDLRNTMIDLMQISDFPIWMRLYIIYTFASKIKNNDHPDTQVLIEQYNSVDYLLKICSQLLSIEVNLPTKLQLMTNYLGITQNVESTDFYEKHTVELFNNALEIEVKYLSDSFTEFENIYSQYSSLMENIAVNDIFRNINCKNNEDFYYSTIILIIMLSLIKFTLFLEWLDDDKKDMSKPNYNTIVFFARKFEHISYKNVKNQILEFEQNGWLNPGNIFTLLK